jgi:transcriptional regulator with XRE-family HTH domain
VDTVELLTRVRHAAGLSQGELARRARTSRSTLSAYENGRKSPTLATVERLLAEAGYQLAAEPQVTFVEYTGQPSSSLGMVDTPEDLSDVRPPGASPPLRDRAPRGRTRTRGPVKITKDQ